MRSSSLHRPAVIVLRSSSLRRPALVVALRRRPTAPSPCCTVALPLPSPCSSAALLSGRPTYQAAISRIAFSLLRRRLAVQSPCPCRRPAPLPPCYPAVLPIKPPSAALPSAAISRIAFGRHQSSCLSAAISRLAIRPSCLSSPCYPPCYPASYYPLSRPTAVALPGCRLAVKCRHCSPHIP